jgi:cytosine/adenosine deaminase-related metal-dependent hydrolase
VLLRGGFVLSMSSNPALDGRNDVLLSDGRIAAVGSGLASNGAEEIDASGSIVMPGLIDSHRHLWYTPLRAAGMDHAMADLGMGIWPKVGGNITPDDLYSATRAGIVDALSGGVTTVLDYCHALNSPDHADRAIEAHLELPGRALFGYGPSILQKMRELSGMKPSTDWSHVETVKKTIKDSGTTRTTLALAIQNPAVSGRDGFENDLGAARQMGIPVTAHVAAAAGGEPLREITQMEAWGLLGSDMHLSHCCGATDDEFAMLNSAQAQVTASPMSEWFMGLGQPALARMRRAGLRPAVGCDAICSSTGDLFEEARAGMMASRASHAAEIVAHGAAVSSHRQLGMSTLDALATVTSWAASAVFMADRIGTLEVGKAADVIIVSGKGLEPRSREEAAAIVVGSAAASDVSTVIVDGAIVKRSGHLVGIDADSIAHDLTETCRAMSEYLASA